MVKENGFVDVFKEVTILYKENFLGVHNLTTSIWEENLKAIYKQLDWWISIEEDYSVKLKEFSEKLPKETMSFWWNNSKMLSGYADHFLSYIKDCMGYVKSISDMFNKEQTILVKRNAEKVFSRCSE